MPKAKKEHECSLCASPIKIGSNYVYRRYAPWECNPDGDRKFFTYKAHNICDKLYSEAFGIYTYEEMLWIGDDPYEFRRTWLKDKSPYDYEETSQEITNE